MRTVLLLLLLLLSAGCSSSSSSSDGGGGGGDDCSGMAIRLRTFKLTKKCNFTTLKENQLKEIQAPTTNLYIPIIYLLAFIIGFPANLMALWILVFRTKKQPSTTLLINMTVTDLMLLLVLPFRIIYHFKGNHWVFGLCSRWCRSEK
ncbi:P2Y purinoceptor 8-like isoform X2 [Lampris incognitus]|uniref:P2Y purinoceptor 8-like isoform X2 n=1 Tax=Lampris incognitus TaxID=2546036 RepID=UPI0024B508EE|nr:P2Y purinoceptor 8-like isoform X2 [Lampris incognitus]